MSSMPPIATKALTRSETSLSADSPVVSVSLSNPNNIYRGWRAPLPREKINDSEHGIVARGVSEKRLGARADAFRAAFGRLQVVPEPLTPFKWQRNWVEDRSAACLYPLPTSKALGYSRRKSPRKNEAAQLAVRVPWGPALLEHGRGFRIGGLRLTHWNAIKQQ